MRCKLCGGPRSSVRIVTGLLLVALAVGGVPQVRAQQAAKWDPARWEKTIADFEKQDAEKPPPKNGILFIGSSTIRMWKLDKSFPDLPVINRGFGGSQMADAAHFAPRLIPQHRPRLVVVYSGDNDLNAGKT